MVLLETRHDEWAMAGGYEELKILDDLWKARDNMEKRGTCRSRRGAVRLSRKRGLFESLL